MVDFANPVERRIATLSVTKTPIVDHMQRLEKKSPGKHVVKAPRVSAVHPPVTRSVSLNVKQGLCVTHQRQQVIQK